MVWFYHGVVISCRFLLKAFNPTMVWFYPDLLRFAYTLNELSFNPTMVWFYLRHADMVLRITAFNPTMVWFYRYRFCVSRNWCKRLSIPLWSDFISSLRCLYQLSMIPFNPTMVWFYRDYFNAKLLEKAPFNPTMVWFYQPSWDIIFGVYELFQSHYGLILSSFNDFSPQGVPLSIPLWSDFINR